MKETRYDFIKKNFACEYVAKPADAVLSASPDILQGVSRRDAERWARRYQIHSIADLIGHWPYPGDMHITVKKEVMESILCLPLPVLRSRTGFDHGPSCAWETLFGTAPADVYVNHTPACFHTRFGPVFYRGRLDGTARVLIVGQDPSTDETLAQRNLVGDAGQRVQRLLNKLGMTRSYVMLNTFLYGYISSNAYDIDQIALETPITDYRNKLFDRVAAQNPLEAIFTFGTPAKKAINAWPGSASYQGKIVNFMHPTAPSSSHPTTNWNSHLAAANGLLVTKDNSAMVNLQQYGADFTDADMATIPRYDLPFGIPAWHGTGGTRSTRQYSGGVDSGILWTAP